jgi:hypothetical protein
MVNLTSSRLMYLKAILFVATGLLACAIPSLKLAGLLGLAIWSFARAYYFAFYVIEHYIDSKFHFAGIGSFLRYLMTRRGVSKSMEDATR